MREFIEGEGGEHRVLVNAEGQYSIWPASRATPQGWTAVGPTGGRESCLAWIESEWQDMRPKSLCKAAADTAR